MDHTTIDVNPSAIEKVVHGNGEGKVGKVVAIPNDGGEVGVVDGGGGEAGESLPIVAVEAATKGRASPASPLQPSTTPVSPPSSLGISNTTILPTSPSPFSGEGGPGWSTVWKAALRACLGYRVLYSDPFTAHPPFQIDANFGFLQ
ncbi:unnamed protein product [Fraxinus pennsylvanica]|uniref:Uncharacterized protein n=1 Tax=Fraxinus pennsylvanica TaxID=56036 RepID=A0AAD1ZPU6_9LAMI|nr:unnamed protein product [Fraxinus pennsylvanica]